MKLLFISIKKVLEKYLDTEGNGTVNYDEFLIALRVK